MFIIDLGTTTAQYGPGIYTEVEYGKFVETQYYFDDVFITSENVLAGMKDVLKDLCNVIVVVPDRITTIAPYVMAGCTGIKHVELPSSIVYIADMAFAESSIESIRLPGTLKYLGPNVFAHCMNLRSFSYQRETLTLPYDYVVSELSYMDSLNPKTEGYYSIGSYMPLDSVKSNTIGSAICAREEEIPHSCNMLSCKLTFETELTKEAFKGCYNLRKISSVLPISSIEDGIFEDCALLKEIDFPIGSVKC